jgi:hypothetical protein
MMRGYRSFSDPEIPAPHYECRPSFTLNERMQSYSNMMGRLLTRGGSSVFRAYHNHEGPIRNRAEQVAFNQSPLSDKWESNYILKRYIDSSEFYAADIDLTSSSKDRMRRNRNFTMIDDAQLSPGEREEMERYKEFLKEIKTNSDTASVRNMDELDIPTGLIHKRSARVMAIIDESEAEEAERKLREDEEKYREHNKGNKALGVRLDDLIQPGKVVHMKSARVLALMEMAENRKETQGALESAGKKYKQLKKEVQELEDKAESTSNTQSIQIGSDFKYRRKATTYSIDDVQDKWDWLSWANISETDLRRANLQRINPEYHSEIVSIRNTNDIDADTDATRISCYLRPSLSKCSDGNDTIRPRPRPRPFHTYGLRIPEYRRLAIIISARTVAGMSPKLAKDLLMPPKIKENKGNKEFIDIEMYTVFSEEYRYSRIDKRCNMPLGDIHRWRGFGKSHAQKASKVRKNMLHSTISFQTSGTLSGQSHNSSEKAPLLRDVGRVGSFTSLESLRRVGSRNVGRVGGKVKKALDRQRSGFDNNSLNEKRASLEKNTTLTRGPPSGPIDPAKIKEATKILKQAMTGQKILEEEELEEQVANLRVKKETPNKKVSKGEKLVNGLISKLYGKAI